MNKYKGNLFFRFNSIRGTMVFYFSAIIVASLLIFLMISLNYTEETIMDNSRSYTMQLIEQVNGDIDSYITYMENISRMITNNSDVKEYLFNEEYSQADRSVVWSRVRAQFQTIMEAREDIYNIAVLADNGMFVINDGTQILNQYANVKDMTWYRKAKESGQVPVLSSSHVQNAIENDYKWVVTLSCGLQNPNTGEIEGVLFVDLDYSAINNLCEGISLGSKGYVFIVDREGKIIYHPRQTLLYSGLKTEKVEEVLKGDRSSFTTTENGEGKLYTIFTSEKTGWTVVGVAYLQELLSGREETQLAYLMTAFLLLVAAMLIAVILSSEITKPLKELASSMREVQRGRFEQAEIQVYDQNEIGMLSRSFNIMTKKIQELMSENIREQKEKRKSELKALQSQVNPHFLYNTLDSIIWMAEGGKNAEVVVMTSALARLLRQSISNEDEIVTVGQEIQYTKSYLTIQKMRYKDKLEFEIAVDPDMMAEPVVKLVLQPLVENAIYHGIKYKEGKGMIRITGEKKDSHMYIYIEDNGKGMDEETLAHIFDKKEKSRKTNGVGVNNVNSRLKLHYGSEYGLYYVSRPGEGTRVEIRVPLLAEE